MAFFNLRKINKSQPRPKTRDNKTARQNSRKIPIGEIAALIFDQAGKPRSPEKSENAVLHLAQATHDNYKKYQTALIHYAESNCRFSPCAGFLWESIQADPVEFSADWLGFVYSRVSGISGPYDLKRWIWHPRHFRARDIGRELAQQYDGQGKDYDRILADKNFTYR